MSDPTKSVREATPEGYYLGYIEVYYPGMGDKVWAKDPVLVKLDPQTHKEPQAVAYIFPGFWEPAVYRNGIKGIDSVLPLDDGYLESLRNSPDTLMEIIKNIPLAKKRLDDPREIIPFPYKSIG